MSSSMLYFAVSIVCGLITPRLIIEYFGSTYNGVISSATQFLQFINILTLGISASTRVALYPALSNHDTMKISRLVHATNLYMRKVGFTLIIYSIVLSLLYPLFSHNDLLYLRNTALILVVSIGVFSEYFFGLTNLTLLQADQ